MNIRSTQLSSPRPGVFKRETRDSMRSGTSSFILHPSSFPSAFTLIELLIVIAIIAILAALTIPAIKSMSKSNDQSQSTNLVRSMITNARAIAISQHRMAGVVFFEETSTYSSPVSGGQTAMQLFVESYAQPSNFAPRSLFVKYSSMRQYLPTGVKLAALSDANGNVELGDRKLGTAAARAILFDANGELVLRNGLAIPDRSPFPPPWRPRHAWRIPLRLL